MTDEMTRKEAESRLRGWRLHCINGWVEDAGDSVMHHATTSIDVLITVARAAGYAEAVALGREARTRTEGQSDA